MDISKQWFSSNTKNNIPPKRIISTKRFFISRTMFKNGYRRIGISFRRSVLDGRLCFSINFITGQLYGELK